MLCAIAQLIGARPSSVRCLWLLPLFAAGCAGAPDGRDIAADMAGYAYQNEPLRLNETAFRAGQGGAAIASSDIS